MNLLTVDGEHRVLTIGFRGMIDRRVFSRLVTVETHVADSASGLASLDVDSILLHAQVVFHWWHQNTT